MVPYFIAAVPSTLIFTFMGKMAAATLGKTIASSQYNFLYNILGMFYGNSRTGYMGWNAPLYFCFAFWQQSFW